MTAANPSDHPCDHDAIRSVIQTYLDGLYEGDADKLAVAFHPTSALAGIADGKLQVTPRDTWLAAVRTRPAPKAQGLARGDQIISIDIAGPTMAFVKLRCQIPPRYFTDQLSMLKIDARWQVAQKVFQTETR
jgi:Putative lumazine-binding